MTMPSERRRALRLARAVLESIANDLKVPEVLAADVAEVLTEFPEDRAVATCFVEDDEVRLRRYLGAIEAAQKILVQAKCCPDLSHKTRASAAATERHFPQIWEMSKAPWPLPPHDWVEFYLLRDLDGETMRLELLQLGLPDTDLACKRLAMLRCSPTAADPLLGSAK